MVVVAGKLVIAEIISHGAAFATVWQSDRRAESVSDAGSIIWQEKTEAFRRQGGRLVSLRYVARLP